MKITPMDIQQHEFTRKLNGYDVREVHDFLMMVKEEFEEALRDKRRIEDELQRLREDYRILQAKEDTLKDTLTTAQRVSEDINATARKEAEVLLSEARVRAQEMVNAAQLRALELVDDINELKRQKIHFEQNLRALVESHTRMLEMNAEDTTLEAIENKVDFLVRKQNLRASNE